jgi:hypothetical protein
MRNDASLKDRPKLMRGSEQDRLRAARRLDQH